MNNVCISYTNHQVKTVIFLFFFFLHRDEEFSVSGVLAADVIHANRKELRCIFRVSFWFYSSANVVFAPVMAHQRLIHLLQ